MLLRCSGDLRHGLSAAYDVLDPLDGSVDRGSAGTPPVEENQDRDVVFDPEHIDDLRKEAIKN